MQDEQAPENAMAGLTRLMAEVQQEVTRAKRTAKIDLNFTKAEYATYSAIWDAFREPLTSRGIWVRHDVETVATLPNPVVRVQTVFHYKHISLPTGWVEHPVTVKMRKSGNLDPAPYVDSHALGAAQSYAQRYSLRAALGVCDDGEEPVVENAEPIQHVAVAEKPRVPVEPATVAAAKTNGQVLVEILTHLKQHEATDRFKAVLGLEPSETPKVGEILAIMESKQIPVDPVIICQRVGVPVME